MTAADAEGGSDRLVTAVRRVVDRELCTGCGVCVHLDPRLSMADVGGFRRPVFDTGDPPNDTRASARTFRRMCPGIAVRAQRPPGSQRDALLGPVAQMRRAWATAADIRHEGSSGGTITALLAWLTETREVAPCIAVAPDASDARTSVAVRVDTRADAVAAAGSRYAPVSVGAQDAAVDPGAAVVCKPCEATALRRLAELEGRPAPLLITFFCAGTPSQAATDELVTFLGMPGDAPPRELRYRGRGWPGRFVARSTDGDEVSTDYRTSWGAHLGPHVQWRCRTCPDGVGEAGDLSAGDLWEADDQGFPVFAESEGTSVLIARTARGLDVLERSVAAGVLQVEPVSSDDIVSVQPAQVQRRTLLLPRLLATFIYRGAATRAHGFGIVASSARHPRAAYRELRGSVSRLRHRNRAGIRS